MSGELYRAAAFGEADKVHELLQAGTDANQLNSDGQPAIFSVLELSMGEGQAAREARIPIFRELWQATSPEVRQCRDKEGATVLHMIARHGFDGLVEEVLNAYPSLAEVQMRMNQYSDGECPIHTAILNGREAVVQKFYTHDPSAASRKDGKGQLPLHYAARYGSEEMVSLCHINHAGEVDVVDRAGMTPLAWAQYCGNIPAATYLTGTAGADEAMVDLSAQTQQMRF